MRTLLATTRLLLLLPILAVATPAPAPAPTPTTNALGNGSSGPCPASNTALQCCHTLVPASSPDSALSAVLSALGLEDAGGDGMMGMACADADTDAVNCGHHIAWLPSSAAAVTASASIMATARRDRVRLEHRRRDVLVGKKEADAGETLSAQWGLVPY
ncbi:hypothetical protein PYCCODRAFT_1481424 [Trametes coccinea BRFM310]|uniref:Hydrophobin n=1 Tax=Trametes coccinea (strain BRFM310) TaxID=1353009 RepID=A0A1Y2IA67_TRAC3|nr:hypothetical protein PYCCODRAFT_1481424 [Trametes coccinea BRFM310]